MNPSDHRLKKVKGILFDKDGTLIDFKAVWIPLALELIHKLAGRYGLPQEMKEAMLGRIGLDGNGGMASDSIYMSGTTEEVAAALYNFLGDIGTPSVDFEAFLGVLKGETTKYLAANKEKIMPIGRAGDTLAALAEKGFILGVSTSDDEDNTRICLEETGLMKYFQYIGCPDDSKKPKPSGDILLDFCAKFGLEPANVAIVGDNSTDIEFAVRNDAGLAVGVLSGTGDKDGLAGADILLNDINELYGIIC